MLILHSLELLDAIELGQSQLQASKASYIAKAEVMLDRLELKGLFRKLYVCNLSIGGNSCRKREYDLRLLSGRLLGVLTKRPELTFLVAENTDRDIFSKIQCSRKLV